MDQLFREGSARNAFGPFRLEALEVSGRLVAQMREITASVAVSPEAQVELEHQIIDPWIVEHPLRDITFVRESPIARFAEQSAARGDALQAVGSMEEIVNSLSQQARIYVADLPRQVRGEIDLLWSDVLPPELLSSMQGDLHTASAAADSIAATAEKVSGLLMQERQAVLDEVSRQRALVLAAIDVERQEAVGAMTSAFTLERGQLLREIDAQRRDTLAWATAERQETILDVRRELDGAIGALRFLPVASRCTAARNSGSSAISCSNGSSKPTAFPPSRWRSNYSRARWDCPSRATGVLVIAEPWPRSPLRVRERGRPIAEGSLHFSCSPRPGGGDGLRVVRQLRGACTETPAVNVGGCATRFEQEGFTTQRDTMPSRFDEKKTLLQHEKRTLLQEVCVGLRARPAWRVVERGIDLFDREHLHWGNQASTISREIGPRWTPETSADARHLSRIPKLSEGLFVLRLLRYSQ
jgi:hypothetical protein